MIVPVLTDQRYCIIIKYHYYLSMRKNKSLEIVSPVCSVEDIAILENYSDGFYFGISGFSHSSRQLEIGKDEIENLRRATTKKLYCALNRMPMVTEEEELLEKIYSVSKFVDAVIIQDIGLISAAAAMVPVHLSVGVSTISYQEALFYRDIGASRVIVPPSVRPEEIAEISTILDVEIFASGSLCKALQMGKCWWDSYERNSSAKRFGVCSKPCKQISGLTMVGNDLEFIKEALHSGACSLKISGRGDISEILKNCKKIGSINWN